MRRDGSHWCGTGTSKYNRSQNTSSFYMFTGTRIRRFTARTTVFSFPSLPDGFSISLYEMAPGLKCGN